MRNPTKKQVQKVIDNFLKVLPAAKKLDKQGCSIDMREGNIHPCKTPMCHGGWYTTAVYKNPDPHKLSYSNGSCKMAKHLGFYSDYELQQWANDNPEIWGNGNGGDMFDHSTAFNFNGNLTLGKIITHWKGVQKRLPK